MNLKKTHQNQLYVHILKNIATYLFFKYFSKTNKPSPNHFKPAHELLDMPPQSH